MKCPLVLCVYLFPQATCADGTWFRVLTVVPLRLENTGLTLLPTLHKPSQYIPVYLYISVYHSISRYISVYLSISRYISVYLSISRYISVYHSISQYISVYLRFRLNFKAVLLQLKIGATNQNKDVTRGE